MKRGFSLIELIFVIVIIGILSAVLVPRFDRPTLDQAANQIVSHIRYTQHLAMVDNKFDPTNEFWYKERWQIRFQDKNIAGKKRVLYTIYQDLNHDGNANTGVNKNEIAKNPLNSKQLLTALSVNGAVSSKEMILNEKYGIDSVNFSSTCSKASKRLAFDYLGRPLHGNIKSLTSMYTKNNTSKLLKKRCTITLIDTDDKNKTIAIEPETGYTHIL